MHRALNIAEIVDLILSQLIFYQPNWYLDQTTSCGTRDSLAALARTCTNFRDPALNFLWRQQFTLMNLLKCLPPHLWEISESGTEDRRWSRRVFRLKGPTQPADWAIPLSYALRIRQLSLQPEELKMCASALESMSTKLPPSRDFLFPNLTSISLDIPEKSPASQARLFLGPKVVDLHLRVSRSFFTGGDDILFNLPIQYPKLRTVFFTSSHSISAASSRMALLLQAVTQLDLKSLDRVALKHISQLETLKSLSLLGPSLKDFGHYTGSLCSASHSGAAPFPALQHLRLDETKLELAIEFVSILSDCRLLSFHLGTAEFPTRLTTRQLYTALTKHLSHTSLHTLYIGEPASYDANPLQVNFATDVIDRPTLAILFPFTNLTDVTLEAPVGFLIDDATAWDIARAWPKLEYLVLLTRWEAESEDLSGIMSIRALAAFAKHCPRLVRLGLTAFDARDVALPVDRDVIESESPLEDLDVGISPLTGPVAVAQFLATIFPNLTRIQSFEEWLWSDPGNITPAPFGSPAYDRFQEWKVVQSCLLTRSRSMPRVYDR
ncbi:hypothetical protein R3P38DRAFT_2908690 [Favolaschia claudopus]|uniref:F-box domain-containing protein n=1 Tax=Favolaschia claudopus TaxID=2862362 RepID=A0AAW0C9P6_9AGAR